MICKLLLIQSLLVPSIWTADKDASKTSSISQGSLTAHVQYLASDELGGRGVGQEGIDKAAEYIAKEFQSYGLLPGGNEGSYFQAFEIPIRREITGQCQLSVSGADLTAQVETDFTPMPFSSMGAFEGPLVFVGYGITNPDKKYDDYAHIDIKDKVVLMFRYEPSAWKKGNNDESTSHAFFMTKASLAKDKGAKAILIIHPHDTQNPDQDELYSFRTGGNSGDYGLPMFHITRKLADQLLKAGGLESIETLTAKLNSENAASASGDLKDISVKGNPGLKAVQAKVKNVIGILPGEGPLAKEYVVFGAHYDHLGQVAPTMMPQVGAKIDPQAAQIHNGADDNASGTSGILELARIYTTEPKPKRTLVFMTFTAEEMGLLGSAHFVEHPTIPLENVVTMINLDMIGRLESKSLEIHGTKTATEFEELLDRHAKNIGFGELRKTGAGVGPSDHTSFYRKKVPVLFAFTGLHADYHKPSDDVDKIDYVNQVKVLQLVKTVADEIIATEKRPTYQEIASPASIGKVNVKVRMGFMPSYGEDNKPGMLITGVQKDRAADKAGMKDNDRIIAIAGSEINNIYDYMKAMEKFNPGDEVDVTVMRGEEKLTFKVKLEGK